MVDRQSPFKKNGIGHGAVHFSNYPVGSVRAKDLGVDPDYVLFIGSHMDKATEEEAEKFWKKNPVDFYTFFYFDRDENNALVSMFPKAIKESGKLVASTDIYKFSETPFTATKAEYAGMALQHLMQKVKAENTPSAENPNPPSKK